MAILGKTSVTSLEVLNQIKSNVATGTAPLAVNSTTLVSNLNADYLDGYHATTASVGNTVVIRTSEGYINTSFINTGIENQDNISISAVYYEGYSDKFIRKCSPVRFRNYLISPYIKGAGATTVTTDSTTGTITISSTNSDTKVTSAANHYNPGYTGTSLTKNTSGANYYLTGVTLTLDGKGHVTALGGGESYDDNTNTKVTSVDNHYSPASSTTKSAAAGTATDITNGSGVAVISGIKIDAAGHVCDVVSTTLKSTDTNTDTNTWRPVYNGVDSTDTSSAATANAVKTAYDKAVSAYNLASGKTSNAGTVTSVKVTGGTGLSSGGTVTGSGTITIHHAAAYTGTSLTKSTSGANYYLTGVTLTLDGLGHVTALSGGESYDDNNNTHYTTRLYAGASGTAAHSAVTNPYLKVTDDNTYRNQVRFVGGGATTITSDSAGTITITSTDTNTDTKVTAVGNHYTPTSSTTKSAAAGTATDITNGSGVAVISGIKMDAAGHVVDVVSTTLKSTDTNTDTNTAHSHSAGVGLTGSGNAGTSGTYTYKTKLRSDSTAFTVDSTGATTGATSQIYPVGVDKSGYLAVYVPWTDTDTNTKVTSAANHYNPGYTGTSLTKSTSGANYYLTGVTLTLDGKGHVTALSGGESYDDNTNTDTKVTEVGNHYSPTATSAHTISKDASSTTSATWGSTSLVTGVNVERDAAGHVTNITLDSIRMPSNPNTDTNTHYTSKNVVGATSGATADAAATNGNVWLNHLEESTIKSRHNIKGSGSVTVTSDSAGTITITGTDTNTDTKVTSAANHYNPGYTGTSLTKSTSGANYYLTGVTLTLDGKGHVTALSGGEAYDDNTNTDTKVTEVGNHYTPTSSTTKGATSGNNYIRGIHVDAAGHVCSVATGTPTDTSTNQSGHYNPGYTGTTLTKSTSGANYYLTGVTLTLDGKGHVTALSGGESVDDNTNTDTKVTAVGNHYTPSSSATKSAAAGTATDITNGSGVAVISGIKIDAAGHVCDVVSTTLKSTNTDTNTDTKVTAVGNHYSPTATSAHTISKDASSSTSATWGSTSLVTGVNVERDAAGHVTNITLDSIRMPSNPNTDTNTHYTTHMYLGSSIATADATTDVTNPYIRLFDDSTAREDIQISGTSNVSVKGKNGIITITGPDLGGYSTTGHSHSNYSLTSHTHSNYSLSSHTHTQYALTAHTHDSYAGFRDCIKELVLSSSYTSTANTTGSSNTLYLNQVKRNLANNGDTVSSYTKIVGAGTVTVDSATAGVLRISGASASYTLPTASATQLGGIKVGSFLSIASSSLSVSTGTSSSTVARGDHSHSNYSTTGHSHSNYSTTGHTHSEYIEASNYPNFVSSVYQNQDLMIVAASGATIGTNTVISTTTNKCYLNLVETANQRVTPLALLQGTGTCRVVTSLANANSGNSIGYPIITISGNSSSSSSTNTDYQVYSTTGTSKYYLLGTTTSGATTGTTVKNTTVYASGSSTNTTLYAPKISATTITASTAFYQSDERLKDFYEDIEVDFDKLKKIPKKYYTWKNDDNKEMQIGTSAQKVLEIYPELVGGNEKEMYAVDYARLSIVALKAVDKLHDENQTLRDLVEKMDKRITELEEKLK